MVRVEIIIRASSHQHISFAPTSFALVDLFSASTACFSLPARKLCSTSVWGTPLDYVTHPKNPPTTNLCRAHLHMYGVPRAAHAYPLPPSVFHDPLQRPVRPLLRLTQLAARRVAGAIPRYLYRQQPPLCDRPTVPVARTRWGTPPGHVPDVHFAARKPAAVIQTVIHAPLFCTFLGVRI